MSEYERRKRKIHEHLGNCCCKCGKTENLHVDHKDHEDKSFNVMTNWAISWPRLLEELDKCQLLCYDCHKEKTLTEGSLTKSWTTKPRQKHGTVWSYSKYKCRCDLCRAAKAVDSRKTYLKQTERSSAR